MRKAIGLFVAGMLLSAGVACAQEAAGRAMAAELLKVMNVQGTIEESFAMVKKMIPGQMETMKQLTGQTNLPSQVSSQTDAVVDLLAQELSWDKMKDDYISLYAETFTEEEMKGIIAFFKSTAGQAYTAKQPELMRRSMEVSQKMMMRIMPKIQAMSKELTGVAPAPAAQE